MQCYFDQMKDALNCLHVNNNHPPRFKGKKFRLEFISSRFLNADKLTLCLCSTSLSSPSLSFPRSCSPLRPPSPRNQPTQQDHPTRRQVLLLYK
jgi:hypothetical protein